MKSKLNILSFLLVLVSILGGCIKNDIPYAIVPLVISEFEAEGQTSDAAIDKKGQKVTVVLGETVNPAEVKINKITYFAEYEGDSAYYEREEVQSSLTTDVVDLRNPLKVTLSLYQNYDWIIEAEQPIQRTFVIEGQIGNSVFEEDNNVVIAFVSKNASLDKINVQELKLGPVGSSYNGVTDSLPELTWKQYRNYAEAKVNVQYGGFINEDWSLRVTRKESDVFTLPAYPWVKVAWLHGTGIAGTECKFEYREMETAEWITVPQEQLEFNGGNFSARITGLTENTTYEYRAFSDGEYAEPVQFTTESPQTVPNMGFEEWSKSGKVVCPWAEGAESYWDCGNWGSNTLSENNITTSDSYLRPGSKGQYSAKLETKSIVGVLATGNLFVGKYKKTLGMNGLLGFGRAYTTYPTRLTGYYKYKSEVIGTISKGYEHMKGKQDSCSIYIALGDWDPDGEGTFVKIQTDKTNNKGTYFDVNDPHIIAYGSMGTDQSNEEYSKFSIELDYRVLNRRPTAIIIVCAASKYGDYFVGGVGSTLWIDDFDLEYDY